MSITVRVDLIAAQLSARSVAVGAPLVAQGGVTLQHGGPETGAGDGEHSERPLLIGAPLTQTPPPSGGFPAPGLFIGGAAGDPQLAVSTKFVVVTARNAITIYTKTGIAIMPPQPMFDFFRPLSDELRSLFGVTSYFDARAIFDPFRRRFWVGAMAEEPGRIGNGKRFVTAVSCR
jgi:hypothetical protein